MSQPLILIKRVRDRHWLWRETKGLLSDCVDWVEKVGEWFVRELGRS